MLLANVLRPTLAKLQWHYSLLALFTTIRRCILKAISSSTVLGRSRLPPDKCQVAPHCSLFSAGRLDRQPSHRLHVVGRVEPHPAVLPPLTPALLVFVLQLLQLVPCKWWLRTREEQEEEEEAHSSLFLMTLSHYKSSWGTSGDFKPQYFNVLWMIVPTIDIQIDRRQRAEGAG